MLLEVSEGSTFSDVEKRLIERARYALVRLNFRIKENVPKVGMIEEIVTAVVYSKLLRLDFYAHTPGQVGRAYIVEPSIPLTDELFDGNELGSKFKTKLKKAVEDYREYMRSPLP